MIDSNTVSMRYTTSAMMMEAVNTTIALCVNSCLVGHVVLCDNSSYESLQYAITFWNIYVSISTGREARTPDTWFWRPVLYQLSYSRLIGLASR